MDLNEWVAIIRKYPLKMKFNGFRGYWESVGEAAANDERFMNKRIEGRAEGEEEYLEENIKSFIKHPTEEKETILEFYIDYLRKEWQRDEEDFTDLEVLDECDTPSGRSLFCWEWVSDDCGSEYEDVRSKDEEPYLLEEHPVEEIWSHACEQGIDIDKVLFICPSCHREPHGEDDVALDDGDWYCGLCGASSCLGSSEDMIDFFIALEIDIYPFNKKKQAEYLKKQAKREKEKGR